MSITAEHPNFTLYSPVWAQVRDFMGGKLLLSKNPKAYLPKELQWTDDQYNNYVSLAPYTNFTLRTKQTLHGALFQKAPGLELPTQLEYLEDNADGKGNGLLSVAQRIGDEQISNGRYGVLVDFPRNDVDKTKATKKATQGLQAKMIGYTASEMDNWSVEKSFIKIKEEVEKPENDLFDSDTITQYRVLKLDENGLYAQELWREGELFNTFEPRNYSGQRLNYIPFVMFGSINNDLEVDESPLYEISEKAKTHFQLSADVMRSVRLVGTPMMHLDFGEMSFSQFAEANGLNAESPEFTFGSSSGVLTAQGGSASLIQAAPNTMASTERDKALEEAVFIGARIVQPNRVEMTASQAIIESGAEQSVLSTIKNNLEEGVLDLIGFVNDFMSPTELVYEFKMSDSFFQMTPDAQMLTVALGIYDRGRMAESDFHSLLKRTGLVSNERSLEDVKSEIRQQSPLL